jgi:hypothetical protein
MFELLIIGMLREHRCEVRYMFMVLSVLRLDVRALEFSLSLSESGSTQMWRAAGKKLIRRSDRSELPEVWGACPPGRKLCLIVAILRKVRA